ncbi:MAG TPA: arginine--tRNA ligase [Polyangiaceae bacterium]|nr:arginine--tRNA ligase [Polyangiaceae bacterium]
MFDPQTTLRERFATALVATFGDDVAGTDPLVRASDRADYQANVAMSLAKRLKQPPRKVAEALVEKLELDDLADEIAIAGPGFINVTLKKAFIGQQVAAQLAHERVGIAEAAEPQTVVIDYSAPNVAKEMHVGHLRSTVIGDALARLLAFRGHHILRQNHLGDWGTPFGMLIEHLLDLGKGDDDELGVTDLNAFYKQAREKFEGDPAFAERSRARVVSLQAGDEATLALWKRLVDESKRHFTKIYEALQVTLTDDDFRGESTYNDLLADVIDELERKNLVEESDGALCMFLDGFTGRDGDPLPLIVRKSDGGYGYATTDLAAIRQRTQDLKATRVLYVVGAPQQQHLHMIFAAAEKAGWLVAPAKAEHVPFGSVLGKDGKMFKTRAGETIKLTKLIDEGLERAFQEVSERFPDLDEETRHRVARQVGIGAFKYADLSGDRVKDYTFDLDRMIQFEGNSAGYIQYAHARCRSILRNAGDEPNAGDIEIVEPTEKNLALLLLRLSSVVEQVEESLKPHTLCNYLYDVASALSTFYNECPVLKSEGTTRESRLRLVALTARVLAQGLELVGIEAPERM